MTVAPSPPEWFAANVSAPHTRHEIDVPGDDGSPCNIVYLRWHSRSSHPARQLVFVHGGSAHAHWWSHLVPFFLEDSEAIALNLGGMGESQHRNSYAAHLYAREIVAAADHAGFSKPLIVAHSFGGFVSIVAAALQPQRFVGVILAESHIYPPGEEINYAAGSVPSLARRRVYKEFATMANRFKLIPDDPDVNGYVKEHLFQYAWKQADEGFMWRYDENRSSIGTFKVWQFLEKAIAAGVPFGVVYGEQSSIWTKRMAVKPASVEESSPMVYMRKALPANTPFVGIPAATHHFMVDQPIALVACLRLLMQDSRLHSVVKLPSGLQAKL